MRNDQERKKNVEKNSESMLIAILSCSLAPLISHIIELRYGTNRGWTTERLLVLYFASVSGYIISEKLYRSVESSKWYKKGFKLGNSDALRNIIWMIPVSVFIYNYDSELCVLALITLMIIAIVIIIKNESQIEFTIRNNLLIAIFAIFVILTPGWEIYSLVGNPLINYILLIASTFAVAFIFDLVTIVYKKRKNKRLGMKKKETKKERNT